MLWRTRPKALKILIVDDLELNRKVLRVTLQAEGMQTRDAENGGRALDLLKKEAVDCVVTDILMPVMDGYQLCQEIRANESFKSIPVIVYTSTYTSPSDKKLALEAGADAFLRKPVSGQTMLGLIRKLTARREPLERKPAQPNAVLKQFNEALIRKLEDRNIQLEEEQQKFRQIADAIEEIFWITTPDLGRIIYVSPAYEIIWGRTCESLYLSPRNWVEAVYPEDRERAWRSSLENAAHGGTTEYRIIRPDGAVRWIKSRAFPIKDEASGIYRVTGVATDVTEEKLLSAQFQQAQKMEAVGRLAGGVAHDFNNLLTAIMGLSELSLEALPPDHPIRPNLEEIFATGTRAAHLTQQLLAFSRRQIFEPRRTNLNELIKKAERLLARVIGEDIQFSLKLAPALEPVLVDPYQFEQVLINLCINARDAMPQGGRLTVETSAASLDKELRAGGFLIPPGHYATMSVLDTGDGMNDEVKAHLFEPFFTTKPVGKGTGLGLSTCFGIIKQSRGFILVESEPGKGSRFTIHIPRAPEAAAAVSPRPPMKAGLRGTETILVAEDEPVVRRLTCRFLRSAGYALQEAANGEAALKLAKEDAPKAIRLLVTDVVMPHMSGSKLAEELRAARPDIKVIFTSGYTDETLSPAGVLGEGVAFLRKPFTAEALTRKVREVLGTSS
ncbi:MAG: response regulator [Elusimicrobiota bacterium]